MLWWWKSGSYLKIGPFRVCQNVSFAGKSLQTTALAIIGKAGATTAFTGIYIYTAELFPTEIRNMALGACSLAARVGAIIAVYAGRSMVRLLLYCV